MDWLSSFFLRFYCLPITHALILILVVSFLFLLLNFSFGTSCIWTTCKICMFLVWVIAVLWATILARHADSNTHDTILIPFYSYYTVLTGGNPELLRSNFMNVLLFYPAGLLFSSFSLRTRTPTTKLLFTIILFGTLSIGIEISQHVLQIGRSEIDDVLHNTLGAVLGCLFLSLEPHISNIKTKFLQGDG